MLTRSVPAMLMVALAMFGIAPYFIAQAPYESTMGLVQKIFYYHAPVGIVMFVVDVHLRVREPRVPGARQGEERPARRSRRRTHGGARGDRPAHRAAVGAQGLGRLVAVGCAADVDARALAAVFGVPVAAAIRRARAPRSSPRAWRCSAWPTCRSSTGRSTSGGRCIPRRPWCRRWCRRCAFRSTGVWWHSCSCSWRCSRTRVRLAEQQDALDLLLAEAEG